MPTVPYSPAPTRDPANIAAPKVSLDAPLAAFGGTVGQALEGFGAQLQQSGNELFTRALAIQQVNNETEAREAEANYIIEVGKLHADFSTLRGKAAYDALPAYAENLKTLRESVRDGLGNPASRRLFETATRTTMARTVFNAATHAATEQKRWAFNGSVAKVDALKSRTLGVPDDDRLFNEGVGRTLAEIEQQGLIAGWGQDQLANEKTKALSGLWAARIEGFTRTNPFLAQKLFDQAIKEGKLRGEDIPKVQNHVRQQLFTTGSRMIANDLVTGQNIGFGNTQIPIERAKLAIAGVESGGRDLPYEVVVDSGTKWGRALGKYQVMEANLSKFLVEAGLPQMTPEEFLKNPEAQEKVFETVFGNYMKKHGSFNEAASMWFSGKTMAEAGGVKDKFGTTVPEYLKRSNAMLAKTAGLEERVAVGQEQATLIAPNEPLFGDYVRQRIDAEYTREKAIKRDNDYVNNNIIADALMGGKTGKIPTTVEELTSDPSALEAWQNLEPIQQKKVLDALKRNAKGDIAWDPQGVRLRRYQELKGMSYSDPVGFLSLDVTTEQMPISARRELVNLQRSMIGKADSDPRVTHALQILGPMLQAAGIKRQKDDPAFNQFLGALQDQLQRYQQEHKALPKMEEIRQIGTRLLQEQATPWFGWSFMPGKTRTFEIPVPEEEATKIKEAWRQQHGTDPTDDVVQRLWTGIQMKKLYPSSVKPTGSTPTVPISR